MDLDFDSFALQQWDTELPPLPSLRKPRSAGSSKLLIRDATLKEIIHDYQTNIPLKFESGRENDCIGYGIELKRRQSCRPVSSKPPTYNTFAAPSHLPPTRRRSQSATPFRMPKFKMRPTAPPLLSQKKSSYYHIIKNQIKAMPRVSHLSFEKNEKLKIAYNPRVPSTPKSPKRRKLKASPKSKKSSAKSTPKKRDDKSKKSRLNYAPKPIANFFQLIQKLIKDNLANQEDPEKVERLKNALAEVNEFDNEEDLLKNAPRISSILNADDFKLPSNISVMDLESDIFFKFIEQIPELKRKVETTLQVKPPSNKIKAPELVSYTSSYVVPASYRRLSSSVIVPYQTLVTSRSPKVQVVEEENEELEEGKDFLKFVHDYETLLNRQQAIEKRAFSKNLDESVSNSVIARFAFEELQDIIWNLFIHMKIMYEEILPEPIAKGVYQIFNNFQDKENTVNHLKRLMDTLPREVYVCTKNFANHLQRIVTGCSENIGGPKRLIASLSNLFGFVFFRKSMPKSKQIYIPDRLKLRKIDFDSSETLKSIQSSINSLEERKTERENLTPSRRSSFIGLDSRRGSEIYLKNRHNSDLLSANGDISRGGSETFLLTGSFTKLHSGSLSAQGSSTKIHTGPHSIIGSHSRLVSCKSSRKGSVNIGSKTAIPLDEELSIVNEKTLTEEVSHLIGFEDDSNLFDQKRLELQTKSFFKQLTFMDPQEKRQGVIKRSESGKGSTLARGLSFAQHALLVEDQRKHSGTNGNLINGMTIDVSDVYQDSSLHHDSEKRQSVMKRSESGRGSTLTKGLSFAKRVSLVEDQRKHSGTNGNLINDISIDASDVYQDSSLKKSSTMKRSESGRGSTLTKGLSFAKRVSLVDDYQERSSTNRSSDMDKGGMLARGVSFAQKAFPPKAEDSTTFGIDSKGRTWKKLPSDSSFKKEVLAHATSIVKKPLNSERNKEFKSLHGGKSFIKAGPSLFNNYPKKLLEQKKPELPPQKKVEKKEISDKQKYHEKLFGWDYIKRDNLSDFLLNQEFVLTPYSVAIEYFIINGDKIFSRE